MNECIPLSLIALLDRTNSKGMCIGTDSFIAEGVITLLHDFCRRLHGDAFVGECCFIEIKSVVMPGVATGDEVIVDAGAVLAKSVPPNCISVGNST